MDRRKGVCFKRCGEASQDNDGNYKKEEEEHAGRSKRRRKRTRRQMRKSRRGRGRGSVEMYRSFSLNAALYLLAWMMLNGPAGATSHDRATPLVSAPLRPSSAFALPEMPMPFLTTLHLNDTELPVCEGVCAPAFTSILLSNGPYVFGCLSNQCAPGTFYLTVALVRSSSVDVPVWVANRAKSASSKATIHLRPGAGVELRDVDGTVSWHAPDTAAAAGIRLLSTGNLIIFDKLGRHLWESFDYPADVLIPGQSLKPGQSLLAGFSSDAPDNGNFTAIMYPGGVVFYETSSLTPQPYFAATYPFQPARLKDVFSSPCNNSVFVLTSYRMTILQQNTTNPLCPPNLTGTPMFDLPVAFFRLDSDGNARAYHFSTKAPFDVLANSSHGHCGLPNYCGPYGICNPFSSKPCTCPGGSSFTFVKGPRTYSCVPAVPLDCELGAAQQKFLDLKGIDYFANDLIPPSMVTASLDDCKAACATNCTCKAAYYRPQLGHCFHHDRVLSMMVVHHPDYVASLKLQLPVMLPTRGSDSTSDMKLVLGISIITVLSVIFFIAWHCLRASTDPRQQQRADIRLLSGLLGQPKRYDFKELQAITAAFSQKLGGGGFGSVYLGSLSDGSQVAVKQLETTSKDPQGLEEFRAEVIALSHINHQNLVHLRGFCADGSHRLLVYEYVANGSLDMWLFSPKKSEYFLDWNTRLSIAVHTARGLFFLHEQSRKVIVHLDVKPQNILLDEKFVAKLSDFGLARLINEEYSASCSRMRGTPGYSAPECVRSKDATEKSDVYSFGMVLLEIVSGRKNIDVARLALYGDVKGWYFPAFAANRYKHGKIEDLVDSALGELSNEIKEQVDRVIKVAFWCIQDDPSLRPMMGNVLLMLQGYRPVDSPPLLFHFNIRAQHALGVAVDSYRKENFIDGD